MRLFLLILTPLFLVSCSSYFKRQSCNEINWYQHGYDLAMSGKRTNADDTLKQCKEVEAKINWSELDLGFKSGMSNYCKEDVVFATGKKGQFFNQDLCDQSDHKVLNKKHSEGVRVFCQKDNGYPFGTSGVTYNKICPTDLEKDFVKEYRRGRYVYISELIRQKREAQAESKTQLALQKAEQRRLDGQLRIHQLREPERQITKVNPDTGFRRKEENPAYLQWQGVDSELRSQQRQADGEVRSTESQLKKIQSELAELNREKVSLSPRR